MVACGLSNGGKKSYRNCVIIESRGLRTEIVLKRTCIYACACGLETGNVQKIIPVHQWLKQSVTESAWR